MNDNRVLDNGQSQSCAAQFARTPFVYTIETLEQAVQVLLRNTYTGIGKTEIIEILVFAETTDIDMYIRPRISDGIIAVNSFRVTVFSVSES